MSDKFQDIKIISLILVGESTVGKTSIMRSFIGEEFSESSLSSIGIEVYTKDISIKKETCTIKIWDTCGQERLRALSANYYKKADGVILVYDITSIDSFNNIEYWLNSINYYCKREIPIIIIGNKIDLGNKIDEDTLNNFINEHSNISMFNTSAKTGKGINEAFYYIAEEIYNFKKEYQIIELRDVNNNKSKSRC